MAWVGSSSIHERQDARYAMAAAELSAATGKPILVASELAVADPENPGSGDGAGHRPAVLPQRQSGGRRPRTLVARRQAPPAPRQCISVSPRSAGRSPLLALAAIVVLPALALFGLWRFADGQDGETVESLPPTTRRHGRAAAPTPVLNTPLLSFRRIPG